MHSFKRDGEFSREIATHAPPALPRISDTNRPSAPTLAAKAGAAGQGFHASPLSGLAREIEINRTHGIEKEVESRVMERAGQILADSTAKGFQEGLQKGREEALAKHSAEIEGKIARMTAVLDELEGAKERIFRENEKILLRIACEVAKRVLMRELKEDPEHLSKLLLDTVSSIGVRDAIRIRIRPEDQGAIQSLSEQMAKRFPELRNLSIEASSEVSQPGFVLETELEMIDATLTAQLDSLQALVNAATLTGER